MTTSKSFVMVSTLVISIALGAPLLKRDASTVLFDLSTISNDLITLDSSIQSFDGSLLGAIPITQNEEAVISILEQAISDTNRSDAFNSTDSVAVTNASIALEPTIFKALNDINAKHSTFKSANLDSEVFAALQSLRTLTDQLASSLERKVTPANATEIASGTSEVDSAYSSAIALYTT